MADSLFVPNGGEGDIDALSQPHEPPAQPSQKDAGPPTLTADSSRHDILASKSNMQVRKRRLAASEVEAELSQDDEKTRKLSRASRFQIFLYHRHISEMEVETITSACGQLEPSSVEFRLARQQLLDDQKNFKQQVIAGMETLLQAYAAEPNNILLDIGVEPSSDRLRELAHGAWSPENFFNVWKYMRGYISYDKSHALGQYYIKNMFQGLALEVAGWLREKKKKEAAAEAARAASRAARGLTEDDDDDDEPEPELRRPKSLLSFYDHMPKKPQFAAVKKACFHELFEHQKGQKRQKKNEAAAEKEAHSRFQIQEAPPAFDG